MAKTFGDWVRHFIVTGIANEQNAISLVQAAQLRGEIEVLPELPPSQDPNLYYQDENGLYHVVEHPQPGLPLYRKAQDGSFHLISKSVDSKGSPKAPIQRPHSIIDDLRRGKPYDPVKEYQRYQQTPWLIDPLDDNPHPTNFHVGNAYDVWDEDEIDYADMDPLGLSSRQAGYRGRFTDRGYGHEYHMLARQTQLSPCGPEYDPECFADPAPDEYFVTLADGRRVLLGDVQEADRREGGRRQELARATLMLLAHYGALDTVEGLSPVEEFAFTVNMREHSTIEDEAAFLYLYDLVLYNLLGTKSPLGVDMPIKQFGLEEINKYFAEPGKISGVLMDPNAPLVERWVVEAVAGLSSSMWRIPEGENYALRDDLYFDILLSRLEIAGGYIKRKTPSAWNRAVRVDQYLNRATLEHIENLRQGKVTYTLADGREIAFEPEAIRTFAGSEFKYVPPEKLAIGQTVQDYYFKESDPSDGGDQKVTFEYADEKGEKHTTSVSLFKYLFSGGSGLFVMTPWQQGFAREVREGNFEINDEADMRRAMCASLWICIPNKCKYCATVGECKKAPDCYPNEQ